MIGEEKLQKVRNLQYVFSTLEETSDVILITGINPSFRKGDGNREKSSFSFNNEDVKTDLYFKKIRNTVLNFNNLNLEYTDLFYLRQTEQAKLEDFKRNKKGLEFLRKQLCITQEYIEKLKPKMIIIFNKGSWDFWGKNYDSSRNANKKVWMGYDFINSNEIENLFFINGLINDKERVWQEINDTSLIGTPVFFSIYLNYLPSKETTKITLQLQSAMGILKN